MDITKTKRIVFYVVLSAIIITYFFVRLPELRQSFSIGTTAPYDFPQDYIAGRQILADKSVYPPDYGDMYTSLLASNGISVDRRIKHLNAHPPFTAMLLFPLWLLSFHHAVFLWGLLTILSMFLAVFLLIKSEDLSLMYFPLLSLFVLAWPPFQANLAVGQTSILVTLFVIAGWYFFRKYREGRSGIFIALATMLKFFPGLLIIYFLINKKNKAFLYSVIGIAGILVLSLLVTKYDLLHFIFTIVPEDSKYSGSDIGNLSINGFFAKLFLSVKAYSDTGVFAASENYFLKNIFLSVAEALLLLYTALHIMKYDYNNALGFSLFIILSLLLSPICWNHYLTLLLLPLVILLKGLIKKYTLYEISIFLTGLFFISIDTASITFQKAMDIAHFFIPGNPTSFVYRLTFLSLQFYGMVLLLYLNFRLIKKAAPANMESSI